MQVANHELAQLNIATMRTAMDSPDMADFVNNLDRINTIAEQSPGFVWRLMSDEGDATAFRPFGDNTLVNLSVWESVASLRSYVYGSAHVDIMRRRREWFDRMEAAFLVLWWVPAGHRPTVEEAASRLELLRQLGPTPGAFNFKQMFLPHGQPVLDGTTP